MRQRETETLNSILNFDMGLNLDVFVFEVETDCVTEGVTVREIDAEGEVEV